MPASSESTATVPADHPNWWRERTLPAISTGFALLAVAVILWLNGLDVRDRSVRLFYAILASWLVSLFFIRSFRIWRFQKTLLDSKTPRNVNRLHRLAEVCLFAMLWLLVAESVARALPPLTNSSVNYPGHRYIWPERYAPRNSFGLNADEPDLKSNGLRVLVLGDSYVEGAGVRRSERFCERLQTLLQEIDPKAQVIAAGIGGWNTRDEAQFLIRRGPQLAPDVVVIGYVLNDVEGAEQLSERPTRWELWLQTRLRSYLCYRMFRWRKGDFTPYWQQVRKLHHSESQSWQAVEKSLDQIARWCRDRKIPCHLAVLPIFTDNADAVRDVMDQVVAQSSRLGITAFSTLDDFDQRWTDFAVSPHDAHPNAAGHERIAQHILRSVQPLPAARSDK